MSRRAAGSAFKPFVYLAALAEGVVNPSTLLQDEEQTFEVPEVGCGKVQTCCRGGGAEEGYLFLVLVSCFFVFGFMFFCF